MTKTMDYDYAVRDRAGKMVKGRLKADSPAMVATKLKSMGYAPVSITEANAGMKRDINIPGFGNKIGLKDLAIMSRQFATMINAGLSLLAVPDHPRGTDRMQAVGQGAGAGPCRG